MVAPAAPRTVSYDVYLRELERRKQAERDRDYWKNEFYLQRDIRRAPVLQPIGKAILEECRHVEKWGTVKAPDGSTRANFTTIAKHLHSSPGTVAKHAERLAKLDLIEIHEHLGPKDECDRKYIHVKEEHLAAIDQLQDPDDVVPQQGGDRFYRCMKCDSEMEIRTITKKRTKILLRCSNPNCRHESVLQDDPEDIVEDTGWKPQNGHKAQKQLAEQCVYTASIMPPEEPENSQKQVAFTSSASHARSDIVTELHALPIWACHREKVPYNAKSARAPQKAKSDDPATWATYEQALATFEESQSWKYPYDGIGVMNNGDYTFIDLDHCIDEQGEISDQARACIDAFTSYTEISRSGTGIHIIARGTLPKDVKRPGMEMYNHHRFFVWTGRHLAGTPETIEARQAAIDALYQELVPDVPKSDIPRPQFTRSSSDDEILKKARNAPNGAKFRRLYDDGNWSGYASHSEADAALCRMLAYWADNDVSTIERLFEHSGLMRDKWNRADYRERTINRALGLQQRRAS